MISAMRRPLLTVAVGGLGPQSVLSPTSCLCLSRFYTIGNAFTSYLEVLNTKSAKTLPLVCRRLSACAVSFCPTIQLIQDRLDSMSAVLPLENRVYNLIICKALRMVNDFL